MIQSLEETQTMEIFFGVMCKHDVLVPGVYSAANMVALQISWMMLLSFEKTQPSVGLIWINHAQSTGTFVSLLLRTKSPQQSGPLGPHRAADEELLCSFTQTALLRLTFILINADFHHFYPDRVEFMLVKLIQFSYLFCGVSADGSREKNTCYILLPYSLLP